MILSVLFAAFALLADANKVPAKIGTHMSVDAARKHVSYLASDEMRGRDTPSAELEKAAAYIASEFKRFGLEPVGGSYFHEYQLERLDLALPCSLLLVRGADTTEATLKADFVPMEHTGEGDVRNAPIVFCGFGIEAPEFSYNDYAGIDARGAVAIILRGEPENEDTTRFAGKRFTRHASLTTKIAVARKHGVQALLVVDAVRVKRKPFVSGYPWPSIFPKVPKSSRPIVLPLDEVRLPALHVGERVFGALVGSVDSLVWLTTVIDSTLTPHSFAVADAHATLSVKLEREKITLRNVVGMIRGSKVPTEYAVMGAHYDHIGTGKPVGGDSIYNGADDNGSGTTGLLLAAEDIARCGVKPDRSIVFVAFSGEEKGLLGSKAYVQTSPLSLDKCVSMTNMDMIGRCENSQLSIGGNNRCPDLIAINEEENAQLKSPLTLAYNIEQYFFRSDQASFAKKRIPVIFYFTGEHADYHKVGDEVEKLDLENLVNIARLATRVTWRATTMPRSRYIPSGFEE